MRHGARRVPNHPAGSGYRYGCEIRSPARHREAARAPGTRLLRAGVVAFAVVVASWLVFNAVNGALNLVDLTVYRDGGLIVRHVRPYYDPGA